MFPLLLVFISLPAIFLGWLSVRLFNGLRAGSHVSPWGVMVERCVHPTAYWFSITFFSLAVASLALFVAVATHWAFAPYRAL